MNSDPETLAWDSACPEGIHSFRFKYLFHCTDLVQYCWLLHCICTTIFYRINKITLKLQYFGYSFSQRFISYWNGFLVIGTELLVIGTKLLVIDTELLVIGRNY